MKMVDTNRFFRGAARAATYNVILQVTFRLLTFVVNAVVLRFISRELLGIVNVRLTLIYSTILFLSRESFRKACLSRDSKERKWTQLINLIWLCLPIGILSGFLLSIIWIYLLEYPSKMYASSYKGAVIAFTFSAVAELLAEPFWVVGQAFLFVQTKVVVEGVSLACKCLVTVLLVIWWPELSLTAFCMAQLAHTSCYVVLYFVYFTWFVQTGGTRATNKARHEDSQDGEFPFRSPKDFLPCFNRKPFIDFSYGNLVFSFMKQSFLKQFLTEGERYLMTIFNMLTLAEQGVYDVINNLGSLVARFVFLPIEESYYIFFSQVSIRGEPASLQHKENLEIAARTLKGVLKFVVMIGCTFVVFGYSYSFLLLDIYGGKILSSNEGWYIFIICQLHKTVMMSHNVNLSLCSTKLQVLRVANCFQYLFALFQTGHHISFEGNLTLISVSMVREKTSLHSTVLLKAKNSLREEQKIKENKRKE